MATIDDGDWPWMKSKDDILKVLVELDRLYVLKESEIEKPGSMEMEHPSIADIDCTLEGEGCYTYTSSMLEPLPSKEEPKVLDFTPKKKHYQLNFSV